MPSSRPRDGSIPRSAGLIGLGALAVHQLRYLLAYGSSAHQALADQGHGYFLAALPILIGLGAAALTAGPLRAALGASPARSPAASWGRLGLLYALAILAVFATQETAEGLLSTGHPIGIAAVLGGGGWLALPLAALVGGLCAVLDGGLARLESLVAVRTLRTLRRRAPVSEGVATARAAPPLATLALAFGFARPPPPPRC